MYPLYRIIGKEGGISNKAVFGGVVVCPFWGLNTQNIYSHLIQEAQNRNAEIIGSAMFKKKTAINQSENGSSKKAI